MLSWCCTHKPAESATSPITCMPRGRCHILYHLLPSNAWTILVPSLCAVAGKGTSIPAVWGEWFTPCQVHNFLWCSVHFKLESLELGVSMIWSTCPKYTALGHLYKANIVPMHQSGTKWSMFSEWFAAVLESCCARYLVWNSAIRQMHTKWYHWSMPCIKWKIKYALAWFTYTDVMFGLEYCDLFIVAWTLYTKTAMLQPLLNRTYGVLLILMHSYDHWMHGKGTYCRGQSCGGHPHCHLPSTKKQMR